MKNNKKLIFASLIALIEIVIIIFVVKKVFIKNNINNNQSTTKYVELQSFTKYPEKSDDTAIEFELNDLISNSNVNLNTNFSDMNFKYKIIPYILRCSKFDQSYVDNSNEYACREIEITIFNFKYNLSTKKSDCDSTIRITWFNHYIIQQYTTDCESGCGKININKDENLLYTINNTIASPKIIGSKEYNYSKYVDNKLYYFVNEGKYIVLKKIDFDKDEIIEEEVEKVKNENLICYS